MCNLPPLTFFQVDGALWLSDRRSRKLQVQDQVHLADRGTVSTQAARPAQETNSRSVQDTHSFISSENMCVRLERHQKMVQLIQSSLIKLVTV